MLDSYLLSHRTATTRVGMVAERIARSTLRALLRASWVRVPAAACIFLLGYSLVATDGMLPFCRTPNQIAAATSSTVAAVGVNSTSAPVRLFSAVTQLKRRTPKPAGCWWLLFSCLLAGDVQANPGPTRNLRVFHQNVCSVKNKLGTLRTHAGELTEYDAVCLTETWLGPHVTDSELQLGMSEFVWFRRDRDSRGGGVACAVKTSLSPVHRPDLEPNCEALVVQVGTTSPALLAVCYRPPNADRDVDRVADLLRRLHRTGRPFLNVGDFNLPEISWESGDAIVSRRSGRATTFLDAMAECEVTQSVLSATRGENTLDLAISRGGATVSEVCEPLFPSDHSVVVTRFSV